jgi:hypothetical protein
VTNPTTTSALRALTETLEALAADVAEMKHSLRYELSLAYAAGREDGWTGRPARPRRQPAERPAHLQLVEGRRSS